MNGGYATRYADVRRNQDRDVPAVARRWLRHAALDALALAGRASLESALARPRVQLLYLHHVLPDEERPFRALLDRLLRGHTFLSYSEAVGRVASGEIDRPYVAFSFDDGLRNHLRAAEILGEYGISACFFVCEAMAEGRSYEEVREFCRRELSLPPLELLTWADMERLLAAGHEIGNHTSHHRNLAPLGPSELADEISGSLASLRRRLGDVRHFAWPRGRFHEFSAAARDEVFRAGHASCASAVRGCHVPGPPRPLHEVCLRRDPVIAADPLRHTEVFLARSSSRATEATRDWPVL